MIIGVLLVLAGPVAALAAVSTHASGGGGRWSVTNDVCPSSLEGWGQPAGHDVTSSLAGCQAAATARNGTMLARSRHAAPKQRWVRARAGPANHFINLTLPPPRWPRSMPGEAPPMLCICQSAWSKLAASSALKK